MTQDTIYVLGNSRIASLIAGCLASIDPPPPVTLIFNCEEKLQQYRQNSSSIKITTVLENGEKQEFEQQISWVLNEPKPGEDLRTLDIQNLIIAVSTSNLRKSLEEVKPHITSSSQLLIVLSEMEDCHVIVEQIWPNPRDAPKVYIAISDHVVNEDSHWCFQHSIGSLSIYPFDICSAQTNDSADLTDSATYLFNSLQDSWWLQAEVVSSERSHS